MLKKKDGRWTSFVSSVLYVFFIMMIDTRESVIFFVAPYLVKVGYSLGL